jgi:hypothetical protein
MSKNLDITGRGQVLANLKKAIMDIKGASEKGLVRAGLLIMNKASKRVPVDTGNLRSSVYVVSNKALNHAPSPAFSNARGDAGKQSTNHSSAVADAKARTSGSEPKVEIGYSTTYAAPVHEHVHVPHTVGQAKYLEDAVKSSVAEILDIIKKEAYK